MKAKEKRALVVGGIAAAVVAAGVGVYIVSKKNATTPATTANTNTVPAGIGGAVALKDGAQTLTTAQGTLFSLALPSGAVWVSLTSVVTHGVNLLGTVPAGSSSPVPLMAGSSDVITAVWSVSGVNHTGTLTTTVTVPQLAA